MFELLFSRYSFRSEADFFLTKARNETIDAPAGGKYRGFLPSPTCELNRKKKAISVRVPVYAYLYGARFLGPVTAASVIILRYLWKF